jgi:hypothetical protein
MNRLEQTAKVASTIATIVTIAAVVRGHGDGDRTPPDQRLVPDVLSEQIAQREDIFAFDVVERIYDRSIARIDRMSNRIGILVAAQVATEAVIIDKANTFGGGPMLLMFATIVATGLSLRAIGDPDTIDAEAFVTAFGDHPWRTREALLAGLRAAITRNTKLMRSHQRLFSGALVLMIGVIGWAFW